jgi:methionine synthase II (cobalamin-independent)
VVVAHAKAKAQILAKRHPTAVPEITFTERLEIELGGKRVELVYLGLNHSDDTIVMRCALEGVGGTTAVHICFGYAAIVHERPSGYSFLPELAGCSCQQVSVETAQSNLDCAVLAKLQGKQIMAGCLDLNDLTVETPEAVVARIERALPYVAAANVILAPDCWMKYLPREVAFGKLRAMLEAARMLRAEYGGG